MIDLKKENAINLEIIARQLCTLNKDNYTDTRNWIEDKYKEE